MAFTISFGAAIRINLTSRICPLRIALNSIRASVYSSRFNSFSIFKSDTVRSSKFDLESVLVGYTFTLPPERLAGVLNRRTFLKVWDNGFLGILRDMLNPPKQYCICCINSSTSFWRRPRFSYTLRNPFVNYNLLIAKITVNECIWHLQHHFSPLLNKHHDLLTWSDNIYWYFLSSSLIKSSTV